VYKFLSNLAILMFTGVFLLFAEAPLKKSNTLQKTAKVDDPLLNRARAYLDKGKLKLAVENYGIFSGTASPQGLWGDFQYISNLSLVVGIPGKDSLGTPYPWAVGPKENYMIKDQDFRTFGADTTYWGPTVSESWMDRTSNLNRTDWEAVEDARIFLHNPLATAGEYYGELDSYTNEEDQYPLIATSDLSETWPGNPDNPYWPGHWALDPADSAGQTALEGIFVSDQDIYFEFDDRFATRDIDNTQGYPIGIRAKVSGYSYSASISEDIIFFKMMLVNESEYYYEGVYGGFYFDVDSYNRRADGSYFGRTNDDDMMGYNSEWDFGYIYDLDGDSNQDPDQDLAYSAVKLLETPTASEEIDLDGDGNSDIFPGDVLGLTSWHWFDWFFRPGAQDIPNKAYSGDGQTPYQPNKEEIQYKIIAGDATNLSSYDSTYYFHPVRGEAGLGKLNPKFDSVEGLLYEYPDGLDCVFIIGSGPFNMAPGDSVPFSFCVIMGEDEGDLVTNAKVAQLMYDNNYQGARAPKAPNVLAKEEDEKVTLYWDAVSIDDEDIITGYKDFEGFRIYRSTDNGKTWGEQSYDEESRTSYWQPIAQYDKKNDIEGYEKIMPHRFLGDNSDLVYKYEDENVDNGTEYLYAVCAYDRGFIPFYSDSIDGPLYDPLNVAESKDLNFEIPSLENLLSSSTNLCHIVKAIPHRTAGNVDLNEIKVERMEGTTGTGLFNVEVITPQELTGDTYKILFDCDYLDTANTNIEPYSQRFSIINLTKNITLVDSCKEFDFDLKEPKSPPIFDGLRWTIQMPSSIDVRYEIDPYWTEESKCTYKLGTGKLINPTRSNYEIRFSGEDAEDTYDYLGINVNGKVPFEVWNTVTNRKAKVINSSAKEFKPKKSYFIRETGLPESRFDDWPIDPNTLEFSFDWVMPDSIDPETKKLLPADRAWEAGDVFVIPVRKPFERGDGFVVTTEGVFKVNEVTKDDMKKIKVVPNPYIVHAQWETDYFIRKIQFTNLPDKCKIHVFTVAGERVITLEHNSTYDGSEDWDLLTYNRQDTAPGLYVYVVEADNGEKYRGKFVIIK